MQRMSRYDEQKAVNTWLETHFARSKAKAVFFTLKFHRKRPNPEPWTGSKSENSLGGAMSINEDYAEKLLSGFLNRLDRKYLSKRALNKGIRLQRAVFRHKGISGENVHFHGVVFCEGDAMEFLNNCKEIWKKLFSNNWVDVERSQFVITNSVSDSSYYSAREVFKLGAETSWMINYTNVNGRSKLAA
jgi:hypothetical protein